MLLIRLSRKLLFSFLILLSVPSIVMAAACCGGGFAIPSIITGDDKAQMTSSYSYSQIDTDVFANGVWQKRTVADATQIYKVEAAHIFADRYQAGFSLPIQTRSKEGSQGGQSSGLGDVSAQLGYEYLPDWNYNPWRPHGIGFVSLTLPTGKSIYESDNNGLDSRGRGFFALGVGTALTKTWTKWDVSASLELHKAFEKVISNSQFFGTIVPGYGNSVSVGAGYSIGDLRLGSGLGWFNEDAINVEGANPSEGSVQRYASGTLSASYLFKDNWAGTFSYSDQTLFGEPTNASLSKSVQLSMQKRWAR